MKTTEKAIEIIPSSTCSGTLRIPASKSHAQRALACALMSDQKTVIQGIGASKDERVLLDLVKQSATAFTLKEGVLTLEAGEKLHFNHPHIHFGESGLAARMCTPILANCQQNLLLYGSGSLNDRPMHLFGEVLPKLGIAYSDNNGKLPIQLCGPLLPTDLVIDGSFSSQFITGILYGIASSKANEDITITLENPVSLPYLDLSIEVLREFGVNTARNGSQLTISLPVKWKETTLTVEGDWSSASFLLVLAALSGEITITHLNPDSLQADRRILEALIAFGADIFWEENALTVRKNASRSFRFDATHCPDLFPPLAALACFADGSSRISGIHRLHDKESNRAITLQAELGKLGAEIHFEHDDMIIEPIIQPRVATVDSCNDHRIAMACAIVILKGTHPCQIRHPEAVNKSFPDFFQFIRKLTITPQAGSH